MNPLGLLNYNSALKQLIKENPDLPITFLVSEDTNKGETVLDNCMGSGSTGVACKNLNRKFIGIELDENYFNIAKERIENT